MFIILTNKIMKILLVLFSFFYIQNTTVSHENYITLTDQSAKKNISYTISSVVIAVLAVYPVVATS